MNFLAVCNGCWPEWCRLLGCQWRWPPVWGLLVWSVFPLHSSKCSGGSSWQRRSSSSFCGMQKEGVILLSQIQFHYHRQQIRSINSMLRLSAQQNTINQKIFLVRIFCSCLKLPKSNAQKIFNSHSIERKVSKIWSRTERDGTKCTVVFRLLTKRFDLGYIGDA